jgi:GH15 family glucan-1,4-alpha-glucosidase
MSDTAFRTTTVLIDRFLRSPTGAYFRYTGDSYGFEFKGGGWPLLLGERAIAGIELGEDPGPAVQTFQRIATSSGMIPEQDTLSVSPLGWSHANYLLLKQSTKDRRSFYANWREKNKRRNQ